MRPSLPCLCLAVVACSGAASSGPALPRAIGHDDYDAPATPSAAVPPFVDAASWQRWARAEEVVIAPRRLTDALGPLLALRQAQGRVIARVDGDAILGRDGSADPASLRAAVRAIADHAPALRSVLVVGDFDEVPTFYLPKLAYDHHTPEEHRNPHAITLQEHATYPSDAPYGDAPPRRLAVGRVPARDANEVAAFVRKLVAYETAPLAPGDQTWRRRVTLVAGDPYLGPTAGRLIESIAAGMLDGEMSYDFDLRLTFAKEDSPYAWGFDAIERKLVGDLDDGALVAAYVGHGAVTRFAPATFRGRTYEVGTADDAAALRIAAGKPIFFSIACDTGAFDRPDGLPSLAERMVLNPDGPVAVFASSRESHPYPNALYAQAVLRRFVNERPETVGAGVLAVKDAMVGASIPVAELLLGDDVAALKAEHVTLYNLFGDPATRLRYAAPLQVATGAPSVAPGAPIDVEVAATNITAGRVRVTIETRRSTLKEPLVSPAELARMSELQAFAAMTRNNAVANDKVIASVDVPLQGGRARARLVAPARPGDYVVKAFASGDDAAAGHVDLRVGP